VDKYRKYIWEVYKRFVEKDKVRKYFEGIGVGFISKVVRTGGELLNVWLLVRLLGTKGYGAFAVAWTMAKMLSLVTCAGLHKGITYRIPRLVTQGKNESATDYLNASIGWAILVNLLAGPILYYASSKIDVFFSKRIEYWYTGFILVLPALSLRRILSQWLVAIERIKKKYIFYNIYPICFKSTSLALILFTLANSPRYVYSAVILSYLAPVAFHLTSLASLRKVFNLGVISYSDWVYNVSMMLNDVVKRYIWEIDLLFVSYFIGDEASGGYKIGAKLAKFANLVDLLTTPVFLPKIGHFIEEGYLDKLIKEYNTLRFYSFGFGLVYLAIIVVFGKYVLSVFGPYSNFDNVLIILSMGYIISMSFGNIGNILVMRGNSSWVVSINVIGFIFICMLNYLMIPVLGTAGASIATLLSLLVQNSFFSLANYYLINHSFVGVGEVVVISAFSSAYILSLMRGEVPMLVVVMLACGPLIYMLYKWCRVLRMLRYVAQLLDVW
jgi:O-antigen/teichoic acid export membrane protein